ncbi:MAG: prolyl oligopeptidase family serine peptidase [Nevskia sp.]|nr:prolyl oligopeptidase family serine peptidase [Nevskia sp.]
MDTRPPRHYDWLSLVPIAAGLWWLLAAHGGGWLLWGLVPGVLLLASGVSMLLWQEPGKQTQYMATGAVLGALLWLPAAWTGSFGGAVVALALSLASYLVAGRTALYYADPVPGAPPPPMEARVYAKAALDEALIGYFLLFAKSPSGDLAERMCDEAAKLEEVLRSRGWFDDPAAFHKAPPAPEAVRQTAARSVGIDYQRLRFPSGFIPEPTLPGADRWASHERNRDCAAWMLRHDQPGRNWLLCIHGYRMGWPLADLRLFEPKDLHQRLGLNLLMPILPLHGPRRRGWQSGDYFLDGDLLDLLHAETQALWDLRRHIAWIRSQDPAARIGVLGYSLGGYNTSLLAAHEPDLDFVVAGIPVADFVPLLWGHLPLPHRRYLAAHGLDDERLRRLLQVVSPLARAPQLPPERLFLFAGTADRVVPPDQALRLSRHWNRPVEWYQGGHLTFRDEPAVPRCIEGAIAAAGWARPAA